MTTQTIELPPKLVDLFTDKPDEKIRYRCSWGGRGSGKTRSFAKMAAVRAVMFAQMGVNGIILCGREFMNSLRLFYQSLGFESSMTLARNTYALRDCRAGLILSLRDCPVISTALSLRLVF